MSTEEGDKNKNETDNGCGEPQNKKLKYSVYCNDDWKNKWDENKIGFHASEVHELLVKYSDQFFNGRDEIKVFVPLCGKTLDMKWLYDKGHTVIGVEVVEKAIRDFYDEQGLEYVEEKNDKINCQVFKTKDDRLKIYQCDLFTFNKDIEDDFGAIWDRGAFVAINRDDRQKYVELIKSLMTDGTIYFLCTLDYDESVHPVNASRCQFVPKSTIKKFYGRHHDILDKNGPPHFVSEEAIQDFYGTDYKISRLEYRDVLEDKHRSWGLSSINERLDCISKK